jgi:hypothetical protein
MTGKRTRRDALKAVALPVLPALASAQHQHPSEEKTDHAPSPAYKPQAFDAMQFALLAALVDTIIPRTDTPGASDARVHIDIDKRCAHDPKLKADINAGLARLAAARFVELDEPGRVEVLKPWSDKNDAFFRTVKNLTVDAYYTSREGLTQELGWHGNTFLPEFNGCTHPEHQS